MRGAIYVLAIVGGILAIVGGVAVGAGLGLLVLLGGQGSNTNTLQQSTVALAVGFVGVSCGALLVWAGANGARAATGAGQVDMAPAFQLPGWGWWLVALLVVLGIGQAAFNASRVFAPLLPVFHVLAGSLAALLFLSIAVGAARSEDGAVGKRAAVSSFAWGALGGAGIAVLAELALAVLGILVAVMWLSIAQPGLIDQLQSQVLGQLQNPSQEPSLGAFANLVNRPVVLVGIMSFIAIVVPLVEETTKSLAVPLVYLARGEHRVAPDIADHRGGRPALTRLDGFLVGVAAGAGFTLLEGILNGSLALASPGGWAGTMLLRAGTAAVHCFASGLGGLGWQALLVERRRGRGLGLWLAAVTTHGAWNAGAGLTVVVALAGESGGRNAQFAAAGAQLAIVGLMALAWLVVVVALPLMARRLARQSEPLPVMKEADRDE